MWVREFKFAASSRFLDVSFRPYMLYRLRPPPRPPCPPNVPQMVSNTHARQTGDGRAVHYYANLGISGTRVCTHNVYRPWVRVRCIYDSGRGRNPQNYVLINRVLDKLMPNQRLEPIAYVHSTMCIIRKYIDRYLVRYVIYYYYDSE